MSVVLAPARMKALLPAEEMVRTSELPTERVAMAVATAEGVSAADSAEMMEVSVPEAATRPDEPRLRVWPASVAALPPAVRVRAVLAPARMKALLPAEEMVKVLEPRMATLSNDDADSPVWAERIEVRVPEAAITPDEPTVNVWPTTVAALPPELMVKVVLAATTMAVLLPADAMLSATEV